MPAPDDHDQVQDAALARALRDLELPGPVVPSYSPSEVRRLGGRRRTRRRALWAGSGLVAAVLAGALVWGPLTPERSGRGPTAAAQPEGAKSAMPQSPLPSAAAAPSGVPSPELRADADRPVVATFDVGAGRLTMHAESGVEEGTWMDAYPGGPASDVLDNRPQTLVVTALHPTYDLKGYGPKLGEDYALKVQWVVSLRTEAGLEIFAAAPTLCTETYCPSQEGAVGLIGFFGTKWAKIFYDAVEVGDKVEVIGVMGAGETSQTPDPPSNKVNTRTDPTTSAKATPSSKPPTTITGSRSPSAALPTATTTPLPSQSPSAPAAES